LLNTINQFPNFSHFNVNFEDNESTHQNDYLNMSKLQNEINLSYLGLNNIDLYNQNFQSSNSNIRLSSNMNQLQSNRLNDDSLRRNLIQPPYLNSNDVSKRQSKHDNTFSLFLSNQSISNEKNISKKGNNKK
jgi:hypothetical protein